MSYSVSFRAEVKDSNGVWIDLDDTLSLTYNLADMFIDLTGHNLRDWNGVKAMNAVKPAVDALTSLNYEPRKYRQYEAPNGWGKVETMQNFLKHFIDSCTEYPYATVEVS